MKNKNLLIKGLFFWIVNLLLYFVNKYIHWAPLKLICAVTESNFQHFKAAFFSWIIISIIEYIYSFRKVENKVTFFYSRLAMSTILPWFVFILWYTGPAIYGKMPNIPLEIAYANLITLIVGIFGSVFEQSLARINYSSGLKIVILTLTFALLILFIVFTYKLPWADVFVEPDWR